MTPTLWPTGSGGWRTSRKRDAKMICALQEISRAFLGLSQKRKTDGKLVVLERRTSQGKGGILIELCALSWLQI
jgi:hypothetical protein